MDSNIIIHVVSDTQDAGLLVLAQVAIALGSVGTVLGAIALALIGKRRASSKKKKEDKELDEYLKKEKKEDPELEAQRKRAQDFADSVKKEKGAEKLEKKFNPEKL